MQMKMKKCTKFMQESTKFNGKRNKEANTCRKNAAERNDCSACSNLLHSVQPSIVAAGAGDDVSQGGGLVGVEAESRGREILVGSGLDAEHTIAQLYHIQVHLQDPILAPEQLDKHRVVRLNQLAHVRTSRCAEHVLCRLLRDSAAPGNDTARALIAVERIKHVAKGESTVVVEVRIFRLDDCADQIGGDLLKRNPLVLEFEAFATAECLRLAEEHQRRVAHRQKAVQDNKQDAHSEEHRCAHSAIFNEALCHGRQSMCRSGQSIRQTKQRTHAWFVPRWNRTAAG